MLGRRIRDPERRRVRAGERRGPRPARRRDDVRGATSGPAVSRATCRRRRPLPAPPASEVAATRSTWAAHSSGPAPRRCCACAPPAARHGDGAVTAAASPAGPVVCGTYLHGLFDHPALRAAFLNGLARGARPALSVRPLGTAGRRPWSASPTTSRRTSTPDRGLEYAGSVVARLRDSRPVRRASGHRPQRRRGAPMRRDCPP